MYEDPAQSAAATEAEPALMILSVDTLPWPYEVIGLAWGRGDDIPEAVSALQAEAAKQGADTVLGFRLVITDNTHSAGWGLGDWVGTSTDHVALVYGTTVKRKA